MGNRVTVRVVDSIVDYPRGTELTVEVTDVVRRRVRKGIYRVIDGTLDPKPAERDPAREMAAASVEALGGDPDKILGGAPGDGPPAGNASTDEWLAFLRGQGVDVPVNDDGDTPGREGLKAIWQQVSGGN